MNLVILYGGKSYEHDISILTAIECIGKLSVSEQKLYPVYRKNGSFYLIDNATDIYTYKNFDDKKHQEVIFAGGNMLKVTGAKAKKLAKIDCVLFATHGGEGENGELSAYFRTVGIPSTSSNPTALAVTIDKCLSKYLLSSIGFSVLPSISVTKEDFSVSKVKEKLSYPLIVKPSRLGSSIGISIAGDDKELETAVATAFEFDEKLLIEKAILSRREINLASYSQNGKIVHSAPEEPLGVDEILSFHDKYSVGAKNSCGRRILDPILTEEQRDCIFSSNEKIYRELEMRGVVRIDYIIDKTSGEVFVSEINTVPGSLATYLFKQKGITEKELLLDLVSEAIVDYERESSKKTVFQSDALFGGSPNK